MVQFQQFRGRCLGFAGALALLVALSGCGSSAGSVRYDVAAGEETFQSGRELYESRNFSEAALALKAYLDSNPGGSHAEEASYLLGEAYAASGQYTLGAAELRHFIDAFPASHHLPAVEFRLAVCFWQDARPASYDQEKTGFARDQLNRYLAFYPTDSLVPEAKQLLAQVRSRLAEKCILNARLYLKLHQPQSTEYFADRLLAEFMDTPWAAEALCLKGESLAQRGKLREAREAWEKLATQFPGSEWAQQVPERLKGLAPATP